MASKYDKGCGGIFCKEPTNEYIKYNPPGMFMYDIISEIPLSATLFCEGKELSREMFQNVEYIPNFLLGDNKIEIKNSKNEYIKVYTMKIKNIRDQYKKPYIEGNVVFLNTKIFKVY